MHQRIARHLLGAAGRDCRRPEMSPEGINDQCAEDDSRGSRGQRVQDGPASGGRPMHSHNGPSAVAQAQRNQTDYKKDGNLVGNDVIDIMANHDHASPCQFGQREPALCGRPVWDGISFAERRPVAVIDRLGQICFPPQCFQQVSLWAMRATFGIAGRTREQIA